MATGRAGFGGYAMLVPLKENAIFGLAAASVVVRIARSADRLAIVERELYVAR